MTQCNIEKKENKHFRRFNLFVGVSYHVTYITKQPISQAHSPALGVSLCPRYSPPGNTEPTDFCYHCAIYFNLTLNKPSNIRKTIVSRALKSIDASNLSMQVRFANPLLSIFPNVLIRQFLHRVMSVQFSRMICTCLFNLYASPATVLRQQMICSLGYQRDRFLIIPSSYISNLRDYRQLQLLNYHLYANDTQLYLTFKTDDINADIESIVSYMAEISSQMGQNELKLNLA